ncbi:MAG TPA: arsenate reductase [Bacteroidetes bacterium]|nr:arsenate reductase [Bacteroidota bacterium]
MNILFLCTGNSCRSQMAEGWARALAPDRYHIYSAGVEAHGLNPLAIKVMHESGIDISTHSSQVVDELNGVDWDIVVTVCDSARERCPYLPGTHRLIHHSFDDPPRLSAGLPHEEALVVYRRVRDEIKEFVQELINETQHGQNA